jgi:hypothetical protein
MLVSSLDYSSTLKMEATGFSAVAAATPNAKGAKLSDQTVKTTEPAPNKCSTDGDMATFIATVQDVMTGLRIARTEDDSFAFVMKAVCGLVRKQGRAFAVRAAHFALRYTSNPCSSQS